MGSGEKSWDKVTASVAIQNLHVYLYRRNIEEVQIRQEGTTVDSSTLKVLEQTAMSHEFCDNVDWLILRAHSVQLDELLVSQLLHDLCLSQEVLWVHRACNIVITLSNFIDISVDLYLQGQFQSLVCCASSWLTEDLGATEVYYFL